MAHYELDYPEYPSIAINAERSERAAFIRRTYAHLGGAVLAFMGLLFGVFTLIPEASLRDFMLAAFRSPVSILVLFALFIGAGYLAQWWAHASTSPAMQYAGLGLYVLVEAIIFVPILWVVQYHMQAPHLIAQAGILTLCVFGALTLAVFTTGKDFSFLGPILSIAGFMAMGLIVCAIIFQFSLGLVFAFAMVAFASGFILYETSNVLHRYRTDQYVGAALQLFAAVALLFYYILRIFMSSRE